jgi:hypothetical protein
MNEKHYHSFDVTFVVFFDNENDHTYNSGNDWKSRQCPGLPAEEWVNDFQECYPNAIHMTNIVKANNLFIFFKYGVTKFSEGFNIEEFVDLDKAIQVCDKSKAFHSNDGKAYA